MQLGKVYCYLLVVKTLRRLRLLLFGVGIFPVGCCFVFYKNGIDFVPMDLL